MPNPTKMGPITVQLIIDNAGAALGNAANPIAIQVTDGEGSGRQAGIDPLQNIFPSISEPHHEVHEGDSYHVFVYDPAMANTETLVIAFKTPDTTKWFHSRFSWEALARAKFEIFEAPTWDASSGTTFAPRNRNRNSTNTTLALEDTTSGTFAANGLITLNPTNLAGGLLVVEEHAFTGKAVATEREDSNEYILKQNTQYAFCLTALANSNSGGLIVNWYEHLNE